MSAPTTRNTSYEQALDHIASETQVWVRVAGVRDYNGIWQVRLAEIDCALSLDQSKRFCRRRSGATHTQRAMTATVPTLP